MQLDRRSFLKISAGMAAAGVFPFMKCAPIKRENPNIIFIFADDLGYGDVSCQNPNSKIQTPNLDKLASQGVRFTDAHTSSAVCSPSRYSVLTGRYNWRSQLKSGVLNGYSSHLIESGRITVASLLKQHGYRTGGVGKWHLGWDWAQKSGDYNRELIPLGQKKEIKVDYTKPVENGPTAFGFDYFFGIPASLDITPYVYLENEKITAPVEKIAPQIKDSLKYQRGGECANDFEHIDCLPTLTKKAVEFIRSSADSPFFLYFPLPAPHTPVLPTPEFEGKSQAGPYGDFVVMVDDVVGQVMKVLEEKKISENTLLIVSSDNGPETIAYPRIQNYGHYSMGELRGIKRDLWEGGTRVPYIVRWPQKIQPGRVCHEIIGTTDLMATVAALLGVKLPENAAEDSYNVLPALLGDDYKSPIREAIVYHSVRGEFAIRQGDWVYIDAPTGENSREPEWFKKERNIIPHNEQAELFNLNTDLQERKNLLLENPVKAQELKKLLEKYKSSPQSAPLL